MVTKESSGEFYGAGCLGKVSGTVTSTLTNCTIERNAFGGGYKAESNEVDVYPGGDENKPTYSEYTKQTGIFSDFGTKDPVTFEWKQSDSSHAAGTSVDANEGEGGTLYTDVTMDELGNVTGDIMLTLSGTTKVGYDVDGNRVVGVDGKPTDGDVFGGGNESKSLSNTTVTLKDDVQIGGNVFGGGNEADVSGSTTVNIEE